MSLKPGEQKALAAIEDALRRTDRRLAARLATFTMLTAGGRVPRWKCLSPWRLRLRRHLGLLLAVVAVCTVVLTVILFSHSSHPHASLTGSCGYAISQVRGCSRISHLPVVARGHLQQTAEPRSVLDSSPPRQRHDGARSAVDRQGVPHHDFQVTHLVSHPCVSFSDQLLPGRS